MCIRIFNVYTLLEDTEPLNLAISSQQYFLNQSFSSLVQVRLDLGPSDNLGLMIRGGREFRLGIYVTGVERGSAAAAASLRAGDEIVRVNGRDCHRMGHEEAVHALRFSRSLSMVVRDVGKVPVGNSAGGGGGGGTAAAAAAEAMFAGSNNNGCADINSRYGGNMSKNIDDCKAFSLFNPL